MTNNDRKNVASVMRVSAVSITVNVILSVFKFAAGVLGHSAAMISDAIHSASDVLSTIAVMVGVKISRKESDKEHPYGHERLESVSAILLAIILGFTGAAIGWSGIEKIFSDSAEKIAAPTLLPLIAAIISISVKEWMHCYTKAVAKKTNSDALMADAWHHRSDSFSSIGSLIGIIGARIGFPALDPIASVVICLFILKAAYGIFKESLNKMIDHSCEPALEEKMKSAVLENSGVLVLDSMKTRLFGSRVYVDIEIGVDGDINLREAHEISRQVHDRIESDFPLVKHCMVHVNPVEVLKI